MCTMYEISHAHVKVFAVVCIVEAFELKSHNLYEVLELQLWIYIWCHVYCEVCEVINLSEKCE